MESLFGQKRLMFFISQSTQSTTLRDCWSSLGVDLLLLRPENPIWGRKWSVEKSSDGNPRRKERSVKRAYHICNCELWTDHVEPRGCEEDLSLSLSFYFSLIAWVFTPQVMTRDDAQNCGREKDLNSNGKTRGTKCIWNSTQNHYINLYLIKSMSWLHLFILWSVYAAQILISLPCKMESTLQYLVPLILYF